MSLSWRVEPRDSQTKKLEDKGLVAAPVEAASAKQQKPDRIGFKCCS